MSEQALASSKAVQRRLSDLIPAPGTVGPGNSPLTLRPGISATVRPLAASRTGGQRWKMPVRLSQS
jgi:hypothetical protein